MKSLALTVALLLAVSVVECGRVLVAAPFGTRSHQNTFVPMMKELAGRGHHLTLITNYRSKDLEQISNVDQIEIESLQLPPVLFKSIFNYSSTVDKSEAHYAIYNVLGVVMRGTKEWVDKTATETYSNPQVLQLLKNGTFDLVLVSYANGCTMYPLAWHFNASLAIINMVRASMNENTYSDFETDVLYNRISDI